MIGAANAVPGIVTMGGTANLVPGVVERMELRISKCTDPTERRRLVTEYNEVVRNIELTPLFDKSSGGLQEYEHEMRGVVKLTTTDHNAVRLAVETCNKRAERVGLGALQRIVQNYGELDTRYLVLAQCLKKNIQAMCKEIDPKAAEFDPESAEIDPMPENYRCELEIEASEEDIRLARFYAREVESIFQDCVYAIKEGNTDMPGDWPVYPVATRNSIGRTLISLAYIGHAVVKRFGQTRVPAGYALNPKDAQELEVVMGDKDVFEYIDRGGEAAKCAAETIPMELLLNYKGEVDIKARLVDAANRTAWELVQMVTCIPGTPDTRRMDDSVRGTVGRCWEIIRGIQQEVRKLEVIGPKPEGAWEKLKYWASGNKRVDLDAEERNLKIIENIREMYGEIGNKLSAVHAAARNGLFRQPV
jgi:hypothetical protein